MTRRDWISLGTTAGLHLLLLLLFAVLSAGRPDVPQIGYMEVEFGPLAEGQPVEAAEEPTPPEPAPESPETEEQPDTEPTEEAPEEPVELPESEDTEEAVPPTEEEPEEESPEPETEPDEGNDTSDAESDPEADDGAETDEAPTEEGETEADDGTSTDDDRSAPYDIEGLNRDPQFAPLPVYNEQVNARVRVRITVDPQGNIVRRIPLIKGDPALDEAVMDALSRWQFNSLPEGAPQENQTGIITFTFRLE
ncbi:MAG: energy transducer TonB [Longimonas sp.]|uniref:energy transducer TonB family protein n=1 Tax=Longimonas sp. TaxID=2039626 RepID=UPI003975081D